MRLVDLIDHLLVLLERDPDFRHFHLDAQTIVLEDYLKIRPHREALLKRYIEEKRIGVGPWYQLNDEFLTSGESTIRSLLIGSRIAKRFGHSLNLGYLPDQFGNISQMPQIFQGFGIDNAVFGRGWSLRGDRKLEFLWEAPDGSKVLTSFMAFWYNNAERFPVDPGAAYAFVERIREAMEPHSVSGHLLLMNGVDHFEAQDNLSPILQGLAHRLDAEGKRIVHTTFEEYIEYIRHHDDSLDTHRGELREDWGGQCLAGTLSSRNYLKQANDRCQILLERLVEPSASWVHLIGGDYPHDELTYAWKLLMENHPHDSICGCSIDAVHDENMTRFRKVNELGNDLRERALRHLALNIRTEAVETAVEGDRATHLVVFNPTSFKRTDTVEAIIDFPLGDRSRGEPAVERDQDVTSIRIVDANDDPVPFNLLDSRITYARYLSPIELPMVGAVRRFRVRLLAENIPGSGYASYKVLASRRPFAVDEIAPCVNDGEMSGEYLEATVLTDGSLWIFRRDESGSTVPYPSLHTFESGGDVGDEYRYVAPQRDRIVTTEGSAGSRSLVESGPAGTTYRVDTEIVVPAAASSDGTERSEETVRIPISCWFTLAPGARRIDVRTRVTNLARDHRLRVRFPSGTNATQSSAEGQFDVNTRPARPPAEWGPNAAPYFPMQSWCDISGWLEVEDDPDLGDGGEKTNPKPQGLALLNRGLREYELTLDPNRSLSVTLLRCVGVLSGGGDAPGAEPVPGAQCPGVHEFEYSILPHEGDWKEAMVWREAQAFATPLQAIQTDSHVGPLSPVGSFLEISSPEFVLSAVKAAEPDDTSTNRHDIIIRGFNITDRPLENVSVRMHGGIGCHLANLDEAPGDAIPVAGGSVMLPVVEPHKIITLRWRIEC